MKKTFKFINCKPYDFTDKGVHYSGFSCKCFDTESNEIIKVKTEKMINLSFGDDIEVDVVFNGRYVKYVA